MRIRSPKVSAREPVRPQGAAYNTDVGQFLLDYDAVRTAASPDDALLDFMQSTYEAAANRGKWDRKALERPALADRSAGLFTSGSAAPTLSCP